MPAPGLYLVATPIGNLRDVTLRALDVLAQADVVACEDTRITRRLLQRYGIDTPMLSYHDHNAPRVRPNLIKRLESGETVALCSDAGTPLVNDPGYKLVTAAIDAGIDVQAMPGPSSALTALLVAGLPCERFMFLGFPPTKAKRRLAFLADVRDVDAALVLFEGPSRLAAMLKAAAEALGDRQAAITRELTKLHEEIRRDHLSALAAHYLAAGPPKGEVTVVIAPKDADVEVPVTDVDALLSKALVAASLKDAVDQVTGVTGWPRRRVYARALELRDTD